MIRTATVFLLLAACGGGQAPIAPPSALVGDGGTTATSPNATTPPPAGLPPMATMPPPGVTGSKKAKTKAAPACSVSATAADPMDALKRTGESCAAANKLRAVGAPLRGQQSDKDPHAEHKLRVEANKCYRIFFATSADARDAVIVVRDSAGDIVAEAPGPSVPQSGLMCFTTADEVTLLVGVGAGKGAYAAQVWSE
jgi:hypothetical protein